MSLKAAGAYLQRLRENKGLSRAEIAKLTQTSASQIFRIEEGKGESRASLVAGFTRAVNGGAEDVFSLLLNPHATADDGLNLAELRIIRGDQALPLLVHPEVASVASRLTDYDLGKWVALGERLIEERKQQK